MQLLNRLTVGDYGMVEDPLFYSGKNKSSFYFNQRACDMIGLVPGDLVELQVNGVFVYISKTFDKSGFKVRRIGENKGLSFGSKLLLEFLRKHWKRSEGEQLAFLLKESSLEPQPFIKWELNLKVYKHG